MTAPPRAGVPARQVLARASARSERDGHENLGFLSESHGFLPRQAPRLALPSSHQAWDDTAARLPELFRTLTLRATFDALPLLPATADALADDALLRAAAILGISAHAYFYADPDPPEALPAGITQPWQEVSARLGRPGPNLSFIDLNAYNWRLRDGRSSDAMTVENLALLIPILGNADERRFQMTPVEMLAVFAPVVGASVRAQEAVADGDAPALKRELTAIADVVEQLSASFAKVDPNPHSPRYVNPVVWGKTVAPLATPFQAVDPPPGPSGTAIPAFQLLDIVFGRRDYATTIGRETALARQWFPQHWRDFLTAAEAISVPEFVARHGDRALHGVFAEARAAYAGEDGLLGRHRLKTFGFLDLSFKAGRSKTLGGFAGSFEDRPWDRMDAELALARLERVPAAGPVFTHARLDRVEDVRADPWVGHVVLDVHGSGIRHRPGSRCAVLPEQSPELVARTLAALHARGDEPVQLDAVWLAAIGQREGFETARVLPLRALLTFGRLRPLRRDIAKALYVLTRNETLRRIIEARAEDQWELWDVLALLEEESAFRPASLWKSHPREGGSICAVVPPDSPRMYSISSAMPAEEESAAELHLTVGALRYTTPASPVSRAALREGSASCYLARHAAPAGADRRRVSVQIVQPAGFRLPDDHRRPVVMIAAGTGISPFLGMIAARARQPDAGETWLYLGTRTRADVYGAEQLRGHVAAGALHVRIALSREDRRGASQRGRLVWSAGPRGHVGALLEDEVEARRLWQLLRSESDGGPGGHVYVCGRTRFAASVEESLEAVAARFLPGAGEQRREQARDTLFRLNGEGRYAREVYTTYPGPHFAAGPTYDASDVADRNDPDRCCWTIIAGRVYDLTRFAQLHPGGDKIIRSYAGLDATQAYRTVGHDVHPEVDALLGLYELGTVRRLDFGSAWGVAVAPPGLRFVTVKDAFRIWVQLLFRVVEIENAVANDYGIRHEPVTHDEHRDRVSMSPYKARALLETHRRFIAEHLAGLTSQRFGDLWAVTSGLDGAYHDVGWMQQQLTEVLHSEAAAGAAALSTALADSLRGLAHLPPAAAAVELSRADAIVSAVEVEDRRFVAAVKAALRDGVRVFERHESEAIAAGSAELLAAVAGLPGLVRDYLARLAALHR